MNTMLAVLALAVPPGPLTADAPTADRGTVKAGPLLAHTFRVTNTSAAPLAVTGIEASCGCVRHGISRKQLAPGESADVSVEVNSLTQPAGPNAWRFTIVFQLGDTAGRLDLVLKATLVREVTVTPPMLAVSTDGAAAVELTVADTRTPPLKVTAAVPTAKFLTASMRPDASGKTVVAVTVAADAPAGVHDEMILLTTVDPAYPELRVPVRVTKWTRDAVRAYPDAVEQRAGGPVVVQLRRADGGPVEVATASATGGLAVRWSNGSGPVTTLRVAAGGGPGEVTVTFARPAGQRLVIPVGPAD